MTTVLFAEKECPWSRRTVGESLNMCHVVTGVDMQAKLFLFAILLLHILLPGCSQTETEHEPTAIELVEAVEVIRTALKIPDTTTIHIEQKPITDPDLELLRDNPDITNLLLDESEITDSGIATITTLPNLIHLRVRSKVTDACIDDLLRIESLKVLNLPYADFTDEGLQRLANHPRIELLRLRSPRVTDASMPAISKMQNLAFLHFIEIPITDVGLEAFFKGDQLQSLYLDDCGITNSGLSKLLKHQPDLHLHVNQAHLDNDPNEHSHDH